MNIIRTIKGILPTANGKENRVRKGGHAAGALKNEQLIKGGKNGFERTQDVCHSEILGEQLMEVRYRLKF